MVENKRRRLNRPDIFGKNKILKKKIKKNLKQKILI